LDKSEIEVQAHFASSEDIMVDENSFKHILKAKWQLLSVVRWFFRVTTHNRNLTFQYFIGFFKHFIGDL